MENSQKEGILIENIQEDRVPSEDVLSEYRSGVLKKDGNTEEWFKENNPGFIQVLDALVASLRRSGVWAEFKKHSGESKKFRVFLKNTDDISWKTLHTRIGI
jgi:hypothetical protein